MKASEIYLKLLRWGIFASLFLPLIIFSQYISPFHFGKMVLFRSLVAIMAVIYILLVISDKKYLPQWTPITIAFTIFTGIYALTSFTGVDFNYSFWGTLERMGGLFSFLHFWVFFIILVSVFRDRKSWEKILKISIFVGLLSILFAYGQYFKMGDFFVGWQHGSRLIGTIGNAALFAGYLLFILFLSIYFLIKKKTNIREKFLYGLVLILGIPVLHLTAVRGSIIAFWFGLFLLGLIYLFLFKKRKVKVYISIALIIFLLLVGFIWLNKNKEWVKDIGWLERITSISLETQTLQTRLWSWHSGWQGFKERPILGWGPENFVLAHAKHFDARHFTSMGSETIWDRAHNIVLEILTTMGIVGLLSYLSIFAAVYYLLIKSFRKKRIKLTTFAVFGVMLFVYFFHNLFIFDTAANYFMFFLILGYINFTTSPISVFKKLIPSKEKKSNAFLIIVLAILAIILIYKANVEPMMANYTCTRAIIAGKAGSGQEAFNKYQEALSYKSYQGKYETRHKLATFVIQYNEINQIEGRAKQELLNYAIREVKKNIESHPLDYVPHLYLGRLYIYLIPEEAGAGEKAEEAINKALSINDKNPRVWYELGQAHLSQKKYDEAVEIFKHALELNPEVAQSHWFLGISYAKAGELREAIKYIEQAVEKGYDYKKSISNIIRLIDIYSQLGDYYKIIDLYKAGIELQPNNAQWYASLAAAYAKVGDYNKAVELALKSAEINESFREEAEAFIKSLGR